MESVKKIARYYARILKSGRGDPDFFEMVRRIEQTAGTSPVGKSSTSQTEPLRFGQVPCLHFPETSIAEISDRDRILILVYFMGLTGVNGPMPLEFTNYVFQRAHNSYDHSIRRFLDIINHRFIGLFYRAWKANEQAASFDAPDGGLVTRAIRALGGGVDADPELPEWTGTRWCGVFGTAVKSRDGLEMLLREYFRLPLRVADREVSAGIIPEEYRCRLGCRETAELGRSIQLGSRFYSVTGKFTVAIGPTSFGESRFMLPGARGFDDLTALVCRYLDHPLEYDLKITLNSNTLPQPKLNGSLQLGRDIWLPGTKHRHTILTIGASRLVEKRHRDSYSSGRSERAWQN